MPKIQTLGMRPGTFDYTGSVEKGTTILYSGKPFVSADLYKAILETFQGQKIIGGFSMTNPTPGGLGEWLEINSKKFGRTLARARLDIISDFIVSTS